MFYLPTLKDVFGHYRLWNEVMFWFTQMMCYNVYRDPIYVQNCRVMRFMLFMISINIDYFIESATYGFLFTSCKTLENERVRAANE